MPWRARAGSHGVCVSRGQPLVSQPLIVARHADDHVDSGVGLCVRLRLDVPPKDGPRALVVVQVSEEPEVDVVLLEQRLERRAEALGANLAIVVVVGRAVHGLVAVDDDPRSDGAVDCGEVGGEEGELRLPRGRTGW
jgi:hypothetical protein